MPTHKKARSRSNKPTIFVGIGASAGGFTALKQILSHLVSAERIAFVIVQHLSPTQRDLTLSLLTASSPLPVHEAQTGMSLAAGQIYFAPPHTLVTVKKGKLEVTAPADRLQRLGAIDTFMSSLAADQGEKAVGVILSGNGSDGTLGLLAISNAGGLTLVQEPALAAHPSMPESAIAGGLVDKVLSPERMPAELANYERYMADLKEKNGLIGVTRQITAALTKICGILLKRTQHDFKHYKTSTLVRRIQRRMQVMQVASVDQYVDHLANSEDESAALFKEILVKVTNFFRDPEAFQVLRREAISNLVEQRGPNDKIRIWVAGCSTGEEAYSLAMLFQEELASKSQRPEVQIIATDIDEVSLEIARKGIYPSTIVDDVSPERLKRFFVRSGGQWRVSKEIREMCLFSVHSLIKDPPFSQIDLISCRNVLIYFGSHLQRKVIPVFHYALRVGGYLFLGTSESLSTHRELFRPLNAKYRIAQRKSTAVRSPMNLPAVLSPTSATSSLSDASRTPEINFNLIAQRIVLDEFAPKYVIVNEDNQLVCVSTGIVHFLEPAEGSFQNDIVRLIRQSLRSGVRTVLGEARRHKRKASYDHATLEGDEGAKRRIEVIAQPMPQLGDDSPLYMLVFRDLGLSLATAPIDAGGLADNSVLIQQLEFELAKTREELEKTVRELESSNEELKSSNEELLSMNEELQSANEELETSKEEVQAANEALQKVNSDLENLLASTPVATLFLDRDHCIRGFTPHLSRIYSLRKIDVGRPITDFANTADAMPPYPEVNDVSGITEPLEHEIRAAGSIFLRRVTPYKTPEGQCSGIVATFIDVTEMRKVEERFRLANNSAQICIWDWDIQSDELIWVTHPDIVLGAAYTSAPDKKAQFASLKAAVHPDDRQAVLDVFEQARHGRQQEFTLQHRIIWPNGQVRWVQTQARVFLTAAAKPLRVIGTHVDVTDIREAEEELRASREHYRLVFRASPLPKWIIDVETGGFIDANDTALAHFGYTRSDLDSMTIADLVSPHSAANPALPLEGFSLESLRAPQRPTLESASYLDPIATFKQGPMQWVNKKGELIDVEISAHSIQVNGRQASLMVTVDVTERLRIEEDQARLRESLSKAKQWAEQANAAKTRFLANMSHEIRTPLTAIAGYSQLLATARVGDDETRECLDSIDRNSSQLVRLIDDMLDLSKIEVGKLRIDQAPFDPKALLSDAVSTVALQAKEKGIDLLVSWLTPPPATIVSDAKRLRQVVINLLNNAVKFTEVGQVTVTARVITAGQLALSGTLEIRVADTGIGIRSELAEEIFEPFSQGDGSITRRFGGSGLGLALSSNLIQLLNGDLKLVRSEPGKGSEFLVVVDVGLPEQGLLATSSLTSHSEMGPRIDGVRVMIVDDIADNVTIVKKLVLLAGGIVCTAASAKEALRTYSAFAPDVILMDLQMPEMDGYQLLAELRKRGCQIPVIAFTAHAMKEERERCLRAGFAAHVTKPVGRYKLVRALRSVLALEPVLS